MGEGKITFDKRKKGKHLETPVAVTCNRLWTRILFHPHPPKKKLTTKYKMAQKERKGEIKFVFFFIEREKNVAL